MNKTLQLSNLKTGTVMNAKISAIVFCVEPIINLSLYSLHDCTFNADSKNSVRESRIGIGFVALELFHRRFKKFPI